MKTFKIAGKLMKINIEIPYINLKTEFMSNQQQNRNPLSDIDLGNIKTRYINGESLNKLSIEFNINISTLKKKLEKFGGIQFRTVSEGVRLATKKPSIELSDDFLHLITGLVLGDGSLRVSKNAVNPYFNYTDKHREVFDYLIPIFENEGIKCGNVRQCKTSKCYSFQTECRSEFLDLYNTFYPKDIMMTQKSNRKILPSIDVKNPTTLLWWYIGDGSSSRGNKTYNHRGSISCKHFNSEILTQLTELFDKCSYHAHKTGGSYYLGNKQLIKFLNYVGPCPLPCYEYKWITRCSETIIKGS